MMILGIVCLCGCVVLESLVPWKSEVPTRLAEAMKDPICDFGTRQFSFLECPAWPPSIAGVLLGLLQLPGVALIGNVLGSATAFQIFASLLVVPLPSSLKGKLSTRYSDIFGTPNPLAWWQLPYVCLATLSAIYCAKNSGLSNICIPWWIYSHLWKSLRWRMYQWAWIIRMCIANGTKLDCCTCNVCWRNCPIGGLAICKQWAVLSL